MLGFKSEWDGMYIRIFPDQQILSVHFFLYECAGVCFSSGLGSLIQAESCLSKVEWMVMKIPGCNRTDLLHLLHRTLGRLYSAKGDYNSALLHFANDVSLYLYLFALL